MSIQSTVTMTMYVCYLAERLALIRSRSIQHGDELQTLLTIFDMIREMAWQYQDTKLATVIQDLFDATNDSIMNVPWKSTVPDTVAITKLLEYE